jgi:uncharacterized membrane protein YfcA
MGAADNPRAGYGETVTAAQASDRRSRRSGRWPAAVPGCFPGAGVGLLGGLVGLGGAEFRLPLLIGLFGFVALQAVIVNKAMSLNVKIPRRIPSASPRRRR